MVGGTAEVGARVVGVGRAGTPRPGRYACDGMWRWRRRESGADAGFGEREEGSMHIRRGSAEDERSSEVYVVKAFGWSLGLGTFTSFGDTKRPGEKSHKELVNTFCVPQVTWLLVVFNSYSRTCRDPPGRSSRSSSAAEPRLRCGAENITGNTDHNPPLQLHALTEPLHPQPVPIDFPILFLTHCYCTSQEEIYHPSYLIFRISFVSSRLSTHSIDSHRYPTVACLCLLPSITSQPHPTHHPHLPPRSSHPHSTTSPSPHVSDSFPPSHALSSLPASRACGSLRG